jgi:hypothetical protein
MSTSDQASVSITDVDALLSGATPQFAMQLKARVWALVQHLPEGDEARSYGERQMVMLDNLALGTTRGERSPGSPDADDQGWQAIPSHPHGGSLPETGRVERPGGAHH